MNPSTVLSPEIVDLGLAIGLLRESGGSVSFDSDWFSDPGPKVATAMADNNRRAALIRFVDTVNGESPVVNSGGVKLLQLFDAAQLGVANAPNLTVMLSIDERPTQYVEVGVAVSFATTGPTTRTDLVVPLYRAGKLTGTTVAPVAEHFALAAGAPIRLATSLILGGAPDPSGFGLGGVDVAASVPVNGTAPTVELTLRDLRLPGSTSPTTIHIGGPDSSIEESLLSLVLGVVRAGAAALGSAGDEAMAALDLIGLGPNPALSPIDVGDLADHGVGALRDWFTTTMAEQTARNAWMGALQDLLGGAVSNGVLRIDLGSGLAITVAMAAQPGPGGHLRVTPRLGVELATTVSGVVLAGRAAVDVVTVDLADGGLTAVPSAELVLDVAGTPGRLIATGPVRIGAVHLGIAVQPAGTSRTVVPVLRLLDVQLDGQAAHPVVDLSSADAVVAAVGEVAEDLLGAAIDQLDAAAHIKPLLGLVASGTSGTLDGSRLLVDPLGELRGWWDGLLSGADAAANVPLVLGHLRDLLAHDTKVAINGNPAAPISGTGTAIDPWSVPVVDRVSIDAWMEGRALTVALNLGFRVDDLGGGCTVVDTHVRAELVRVDFASGQASLLPAAQLGVSMRGRGQPKARLAVGPMSIAADSIGLLARWQAVGGFAVGLSAPGLVAEIDTFEIPLSFPADGDWRAAALDSVEHLVGMLGLAQPLGWLGDLVGLLGWDPRQLSNHRLALADLAADPTAAIGAWGKALISDADVVGRLTTAAARLLTGSASGLSGSIRGAGTPEDPWVADLGSSPDGPALAVALAPGGPVRAATTTASALISWMPGMPGLPSDGLGQALALEGLAGPDVAALARGRGALGDGLGALAARAANTDGLTIAPPDPIAGLQVVVDERRTAADWIALPVEQALGGPVPAGAAVVRVAIGSAIGSNPWPGVPAAQLIDLSAPGLTPESFTVAAPGPGEWFVALARRADATLGGGDPGGTLGQAARLQRVLSALGTGRAVVVIAVGGAGHAARLAADAVPAVTHLVTLGTPWSPIAFDTLRNGVSGDAVRLLRAVLPAVDPAEPDDDDLALGRALVGAWLDHSAQFELDAPRPTTPVRGGLTARAWFASLDPAAVQRAFTAIIAAGLSLRAQAREPLASLAPLTAEVSLRLPIPGRAEPSGHGVQVSGSVQLGLAATPFAAPGAPTPAPPPAAAHVGVKLVIADADGWLIGGPGTTPPPGAAPLEVRFIEVLVDVGLGTGSAPAAPGGTAPSSVAVILHEVAALGAWRDRVVISPAGVTGAIEDLPFLPEARAALQAVIQRMRASDPGGMAAAVLTALDGLGLSSPSGLVPDALNHLLHDPAAFAGQRLADPAGRLALAAALAALVPGATRTGDTVTITSGPATVTLDLATRRAAVTAGAADGVLAWQATVSGIGAPRPTAQLTVGAAAANAVALRLTVQPGNPSPFTAAVLTHSPSGAAGSVAVWPNPDADALVGLARTALPAEATRLILNGVRGLDPALTTAIDAVAAALGLLGPADPTGYRPIHAPVGLFADPCGWLRGHVLGNGTTLNPDAVIDVLEAIKPFVGLAGSARGVWPIVPGVTLQAVAAGGGTTVSASVDPTVWLGGAGRLPVAAGVTAGLTIPAAGPPRPAVSLFVGAPENPVSTHRRALHVALDGTALSVFLRPGSGADIAIYPNPAGLGQLLAAGTELLLPMALDAVAAMTGGVKAEIAEAVSSVGRALAVVDNPAATPVTFNGQHLHDLALDPGGWLEDHVAELVTNAVAALNPLLSRLPGAVNAAKVGNDLVVSVHGVTLTVTPNPLHIAIAGSVANLPVVGTVSAAFGAGLDGVDQWSFGVGPAVLDIGGPELRPLLSGGRTGSGWEMRVGLALDALAPTAAGHKELFARWRESDGLDVVARTRGATSNTDVTAVTDPARVALFAADAVLELLGNYIIAIDEVEAMLDTPVNTTTVRDLLEGSLLSAADNHKMAAAPISSVPHNLFTLARKLAGALPAVPLGPVELALHLDGDLIGLRLNVLDPVSGIVVNPGSDVEISIVTDSTWIEPPSGESPDPGIVVDILSITAADPPVVALQPSFAANGLGVRIAKNSGPLLDAGLRIESLAVHLFGELTPSGSSVQASGGIHVEIGGLGVPLGGGGGDNSVAKGVLSDSGGSGGPPAPKFSPGLAVQSHHGGPGVQVSLRAGSGDGPWFLPIQRAFGPLYLEQVGLGTTYKGTPRSLDSISMYLDGSVSLFGINATVNKLRLTYMVNRPFFEASSWHVDLDGFAISSNIGGLTLAGALLKRQLTGSVTGVDYLGMLKIGFNGYGVDLFGGYSNPVDSQGSFASFFAFGALHAPLGGPPAFFITGIGVGFGINRALKAPTMETITSDPFLKAMKAIGPPPSLEEMGAKFVPARGEYWVAAGISFTSFVLISGEVVVTVAFGDGLEICLLGLARAELPTPVFKLVSIELALLARFSSKEGSLLVQAQLTENSWLLTESVRLTGGFAFATWWKGPNAGQFVVTMGGYHPKFKRDGYPVVPRLGFRWQPISNVSIIGESYFALTSEALMAGTRFEANARFGPAYARVSFGADGIVYFDPFWFEISAYAEVAAGIKLWLLFGTVTIELSLGARVTVSGPPIHVEGRFEICGFEVPFEFGDEGDQADRALTAGQFRDKYLRAGNDAQVLQAAVMRGGVPAGKKADGSPEKVPNGSADDPFRVIPEFELMFITTAPAIDMHLDKQVGGAPESKAMHQDAPDIGVAPMFSHDLSSNFHVEIIKVFVQDYSIQRIKVTPRADAAFPKGVWGEAPDPKKKKLPKGDTVNAADGFTMSTSLGEFTGAPAIDYHQVEIRLDRKRKPLPFVSHRAKIDARLASAAKLKQVADALRPADSDLDARFNVAARVLEQGGYGTVGLAALRGERAGIPAFGSLADDLAKAPPPASRKIKQVVVDHSKAAAIFSAPRVTSVVAMAMSTALPRQGRTTVKDPGRAVSRFVPDLATARAAVTRLGPGALVVNEPMAVVAERTLLKAGNTPVTRLASGPVAAVANALPDPTSFERLTAMTGGLAPQLTRSGRPSKAARASTGMTVSDGEVVVIDPGSRPTDGGNHTLVVTGAPCRVICLAAGGNVLIDNVVQAASGQGPLPVDLPVKTERVVLAASGQLAAVGGMLDGWYSGQSLPLIGWDMAIAANSVVRFESTKLADNSQRANGGWANTREMTRAARVVTRFDRPVRSVAVAVDDVGGANAAASVDIRLSGAVRTTDGDGRPTEPAVLVQGLRSVLVYAVEPTVDQSLLDPNVTVIIDGCRAGQVAGVAGWPGPSTELIEAVSQSGFDAAIAAPLAGGPGTRTISWRQPQATPRGGR